MTPTNDLTKHAETKPASFNTQGLSLVERLKLQKNIPALLLDTSGSMACYGEGGEKRRIDSLRDIVSSLTNTGKVFSFNDACHPCLKDAIPNPTGNTYLSIAFEKLKQQGIKSIILITDGEANDKPQALDSVENLQLQILYVGPGDTPDFLKQLAAKAGTICTKENLNMQKELTAKITLLLNAGDTNPRQEGSICL